MQTLSAFYNNYYRQYFENEKILLTKLLRAENVKTVFRIEFHRTQFNFVAVFVNLFSTLVSFVAESDSSCREEFFWTNNSDFVYSRSTRSRCLYIKIKYSWRYISSEKKLVIIIIWFTLHTSWHFQCVVMSRLSDRSWINVRECESL